MGLIEDVFSGNERETLESIVDNAIKLSGAQTGSLVLADDDGGLFVAAGRGLLDKYIGAQINSGEESVSEHVFKTGEPLIIDDHNCGQFSRRKKREGYSVSLPIKKSNGGVVGVLNLNRTDRSFEEENVPHLEALTVNIAIILEENNLRRRREHIIVALSEIVELFSSLFCIDTSDDVFEKIFYSVKTLTGAREAAVFKLSKKRPYLIFERDWPKQLRWKAFTEVDDQIQNSIKQKKIITTEYRSRDFFLFIPLISQNHPPYLFVSILREPINIIDYLVLSIVENMGNATLENISLYQNSKRLTQERERNRLARELHDGLAQILVATQIYIHLLEKSLEKADPGTLLILQKIQSLNKLGLEESRFILSELKGKPITPLQFREKVDEAINLFATPDKEVKVDYKVEVKEIPYQVYQTVLKILQETLSNIQKHAQAQKVTIHIMNSKQQMTFSIEDDGIGFNSEILEDKESEHFGLKNLKERVRVLRGKFIIDSKPGQGTKIVVKIPLPREKTA